MRILCRVRSTARAEICSSTTAPCVVLPPASMQSCNLCIHAIHGVHAGGTTPWTGEVERVGNTRSRAMPPQGWSKDRAIAECVPFTNKNCAHLFRRQTVRTAYPTKIAMIRNNPPSQKHLLLAFSGKKEMLFSLILLQFFYCRGSECKTFRICLTAASIFKSSKIRPKAGLALLASPSAPTREKSAPL
jgi:hypothetical protein